MAGAAVVALAGPLGAAACSSDGGESSATTSASGAADGASGTVSVLAYNVAGLPVEISKERPDINIPLISPLLNDYDVVLTQEAFDWWKPDGLASTTDFVNYHDRLRADTTHEYKTDVHPGAEAVGIDIEADRPNMELGDGLGVLSRFPIAQTQRVPWTGCFGEFDSGASDCLAMKGFLLTRLTLEDGAVVDIYNLHGEAGGGSEDQTLQADNYEQLAAFIEENSAGRPIILGGDTNLHTNTVHEDSDDGADIEIWERFLAATRLTDACAATTCDDDSRIDKIAFRSGGGIDLEAIEYGFETDVFVDEAGVDLSDHQALQVVFGWARS